LAYVKTRLLMKQIPLMPNLKYDSFYYASLF